MANLTKLNDVIDSSGLKLRYIADKLNITYPSLRNKLTGITEFKQNEIAVLCELPV